MNLAFSATFAFSVGVAAVIGITTPRPIAAPATPSQSVSQPVLAVQPDPHNVPAWKACLIAVNGGSAYSAFSAIVSRAPAYVEGRSDAFSPCLAHEDRLMPAMSGTTIERHVKLRKLMAIELYSDDVDAKMRMIREK